MRLYNVMLERWSPECLIKIGFSNSLEGGWQRVVDEKRSCRTMNAHSKTFPKGQAALQRWLTIAGLCIAWL
jgi:hypothetical protein